MNSSNISIEITTAATIQACIQTQTPLEFWYRYSNPDVDRRAIPIAIKGNTLLCFDTQFKKFYIDGIVLNANFYDLVMREEGKYNQEDECDVIAFDDDGKCYNCNSTHGNYDY